MEEEKKGTADTKFDQKINDRSNNVSNFCARFTSSLGLKDNYHRGGR